MLFSPSATQKQSTVSCPLIVTFALLFTWVVNAVLQNLLVIQATWILPYSICLSPPSTPNPTSRVEYFKACFYDLYCTMSMYELLFPTALSSPSPFSPCPPPQPCPGLRVPPGGESLAKPQSMAQLRGDQSSHKSALTINHMSHIYTA